MSSLTPGKEYERKFLVRTALLPRTALASPSRIEQGYLALEPLQVRVRLMDGECIVEMKGPNDTEMELGRPTAAEGRKLLRLAAAVAPSVRKDRSRVPAGFDGLTWEIDVFRGRNAPLVMAEIELPSKRHPLDPSLFPDWVGPEVTRDPRFKNRNLAVRPFRDWPKARQKQVLKLMGS